MADRQPHLTQPEFLTRARCRPLPVTIVPGMCVIDASEVDTGTIVGITQAYCIYRPSDGDQLQVGAWRDLALVNVCPAEPLLSDDVRENDRRNASATVLRELLALERISRLDGAQQTVCDQLISDLCWVPAQGMESES